MFHSRPLPVTLMSFCPVPAVPEPLPRLDALAVLVVDDEPGMCNFLCRALARHVARVEAAGSLEAARAARRAAHYDLLLVDQRLPDGSGVDWLAELRAGGAHEQLIVITAYADLDTAIRALRAGAADFLLKPARLDQVLESVRRAAALLPQPGRPQPPAPVAELIGDSTAIRDLSALIRRIAPHPSTLLIEGESGTGKECVARAVHRLSGRSGPYVPLNCGALPRELLESELFGHVRGAFSGALAGREGLFAHADGGTLFLDEISELPLGMQTALLRVLEDRRVRPLGSERERAIDVRIITASNRDLAAEVAAGRFRADLYYRLNVLALRLPPLRERPADLAPLAQHFAQQLAGELGLPAPLLDAATLAALAAHDWPGNVRELRNLIERALLLGCPPAECLPQTPAIAAAAASAASASAVVTAAAGVPEPAPLALDAVEKRHILQVLDACGGNKSVAARRLGIARKTLDRKLAAWQGRPS